MKIYLVGFMGCGKTTYGKTLARKCNINFLDLDDEIERTSGRSITELFSSGAAVFRELEQASLHATNSLENHVIATGGGTACFYNNMEWMNANGITVYLKLPLTYLAERLKKVKNTRPLLKDLSGDDLHNYIEKTLGERELFYNKATITVNPLTNIGEDLLKMLTTIPTSS